MDALTNIILAITVGLVAIIGVVVFTSNSADNALDQTRAINDKKEACLKNEGNKEIDDECRVIIRASILIHLDFLSISKRLRWF